jgi:cell division protein FtsW
MIVITLGLIAAEPDLGTPFLLFLVSLCLLFVGGMSLRVLLIGVAAAVPVLAYQVMKYQYRIKRLMVFMSPEANASAAGYQLNQSFIAIGAGGLFGAGLGASKMKLLYLPEPHTDFIFAILAEELGLIRVLCVIALFCFVIYRGLKIAREADSLSHSMMALGITLQLGFQSFYNMGMSAGLVPTKGIPLPFFSYGGSSIWSTMFMIGILLGISARPVGQAKGRRR